MGWSQGSGALLFAIGTKSFSRPAQLPRGNFRAAVAFYPSSCDEQRQQPSWSTTIPLVVLVGAEDVGIPAVPCKTFLDGAVTRGAKVEMQIYPGAYHHFDWPNEALNKFGVVEAVSSNKVAQMAHNGLARVIRPAHTMFDGDTIFALALGAKTQIQPDMATTAFQVSMVGEAAAATLARAIVKAVRNAATLHDVPASNA